MKLLNAFNHFKKICIHKYWVGYYCFKCGIPVQGIIHDLSKFSPTEFGESVKYYKGSSSPIEACKKSKGYSMAWQHHKGRNKHHYEYWQDNYDNGTTHICMPFKYTVEMLCDYLGAGRAYNGKNFSYEKEYEWWTKKRNSAKAMHPVQQACIEYWLYNLAYGESNTILNKTNLELVYNYAVSSWGL